MPCERFKAWWIGNKNLKAMLRISLEGFYEKFDTIIEEAILCGKMKLGIGSHMLTLHVTCPLQVTLIV